MATPPRFGMLVVCIFRFSEGLSKRFFSLATFMMEGTATTETMKDVIKMSRGVLFIEILQVSN